MTLAKTLAAGDALSLITACALVAEPVAKQRGWSLTYRHGDRCPGCQRTNWYVGRKTADLREDEDGSGQYIAGERSLTCNGFLSLQTNERGKQRAGFEPHPDAFGDHWEMIEHHTEHWEDERERRRTR